MTCIVALKTEKSIIMGADSVAIDPHSLTKTIREDPKLFWKDGGFLIGYTTSFRMGQLLKYSLEVPKHPKGLDDFAYMAGVFVESVRKCFKEGGYNEKEKDVDSGGRFLIGYRNNIYMIEGDYQVARDRADFAACGCGGDFARGFFQGYDFLYRGLKFPELSPSHKVYIALLVAEKCSAGVSGPFLITQMDKNGGVSAHEYPSLSSVSSMLSLEECDMVNRRI